MSITKPNRLGIIGRPNVGKSTLFNLITRSRKAVVKDRPGVTRDIQIETALWQNREFEVVDTGGVTEAADEFSKLIRAKVLDVLDEMTCLFVVVDGRAGLCPEDKELIRIAQESGKEYIILVNKVDDPKQSDMALAEFWEFGVEIFATSFEHRLGVADPLDWAMTKFDSNVDVEKPEGMTIAIIGKPNAGKSSLTNQLLGESRMLVSAIAGTTVDSIDTKIEYNDQKFTLIDTAGLRKKRKVHDEVEVVASSKAVKSIKRADIVLLLVDAIQGPSIQDAKMMEKILEFHKAVILVGNKSDIGREEVAAFRSGFREKCSQIFHFYDDIPICFISAKTGYGIKKLFDNVYDIAGKLQCKISTSQLNRFFFETIRKAPAPVYGHKNVKFYYLTQTNQVPPSFIAFVNHPDGLHNAYRRFLIRQLKQRFELDGIPIRIFAMKKPSGKSKKSQRYADMADIQKQDEYAAIGSDAEEMVLEYEVGEDFDEDVFNQLQEEFGHEMEVAPSAELEVDSHSHTEI